jgi:Uncharacterised nucleotidyltransferase
MATAAEIRPLPSEAANSPAIQVLTDSSEFDLLVACCAHSSSYAHADHIREVLSRPLDWGRVLDLVDHHRVVPQVYGALSALSDLIPARPIDALRARYENNARKTLWFSAELVRILSHLESAGIKALPYKGPVLAKVLYGEVTQRQFGDLDVLILPEDALKAKATLLGLGYKPGLDLAPHIEEAYMKNGYECSFSSVHAPNLLELQWRILPRFYSIGLDVVDLFSRADQVSWGGRSVRTLRAEDLLLVLCVHAAKHGWVQLSWLCDIAQLTKSPQLDWNAMQHEAKRLGIERIVSLNLFLAHNLLGSPLSASMRKRLREDPATTSLADDVLRIIEGSAHYDTESISYFRLMLQLRERWQDRARLLWCLAFTPSVSEWSAVRLPQPLQPLYRLVRLSRLAKKLASAG